MTVTVAQKLAPFAATITAAAARYRVPVPWIQAVIMTESSGNPAAVRLEPQINDASYGLMQLLGRTAKALGYTGAPTGLYDPAINIDLGTKLLAQLRARFGEDFRAVYSAYNSGSATLYKTSSQVATHVERASSWLTAAAPAAGGVALLVLAVALVAAWHR